MTPLRVTCDLVAGAVLPVERSLHLDGLLAAAVCMVAGIHAATPAEVVPVEIPVERSACGRYHLASALMWARPEAREVRYVQRRFPVAEAIAYGDDKLRRIHQSAGAQKSYRIPTEREHATQLEAWCVGDRSAIVALLEVVTRVGRRRAAGEGLVHEWRVELCDPWGAGFPVLRDGRATRHLPLDVPGLVVEETRFARVSYPYWMRVGEETVACP